MTWEWKALTSMSSPSENICWGGWGGSVGSDGGNGGVGSDGGVGLGEGGRCW